MVTSRYFDYARNPSWHEWFDRLNGQQDASGWMLFRVWGACITVLQGISSTTSIFNYCFLCCHHINIYLNANAHPTTQLLSSFTNNPLDHHSTLMLLGIFAWCTLCYGLSYSNLSFRTVVRTGPYYFCRHPAYIVKLLSFAMLHVPWVDLRGDNGEYFPAIYYSQHYSLHIIIVQIISLLTPLHRYHYPPPPPSLSLGAGRAIRNVLCLLGVAGIYVIRATTEERHLLSVSTDYQKNITELDARWQDWGWSWNAFRGNVQ